MSLISVVSYDVYVLCCFLCSMVTGRSDAIPSADYTATTWTHNIWWPVCPTHPASRWSQGSYYGNKKIVPGIIRRWFREDGRKASKLATNGRGGERQNKYYWRGRRGKTNGEHDGDSIYPGPPGEARGTSIITLKKKEINGGHNKLIFQAQNKIGIIRGRKHAASLSWRMTFTRFQCVTVLGSHGAGVLDFLFFRPWKNYTTPRVTEYYYNNRTTNTKGRNGGKPELFCFFTFFYGEAPSASRSRLYAGWTGSTNNTTAVVGLLPFYLPVSRLLFINHNPPPDGMPYVGEYCCYVVVVNTQKPNQARHAPTK